MFKINMSKRRYIKSRIIVRLALLLSACLPGEYFKFGRAAAGMSACNDIDAYASAYSRAYISDFSGMFRLACVTLAIKKPLLVLAGVAAIVYMFASTSISLIARF